MPTQWQDQYTDLSNVNNGNELQNGDDILAEHVNVALENGEYLKKRMAYAHNLKLSFKSSFSTEYPTIYITLVSKSPTPITSGVDIVNQVGNFECNCNNVYYTASGIKAITYLSVSQLRKVTLIVSNLSDGTSITEMGSYFEQVFNIVSDHVV